ncbi:unnamed protein product [Thelazia callipaeda]|uniref:Expressed conserved protein n=1 Tax=Thelazia callipaeda TaxID=103827 RepID=A0A0N5CVB3_THECL|nr:unnamed protein product [Thelazia callipaeda]
MVLPTRQCITCPCPTTSTTCPVMPIDRCPCNVQISHLLPCPILPSDPVMARQFPTISRIPYLSAEIVVPIEDKAAIDYLRKLGYVEESSLSPANLCQNLPSGALPPSDQAALFNLQSRPAMIPLSMQPAIAIQTPQLIHHQPMPFHFLPNINTLQQQPGFAQLNSMQPINILSMQEQDKQQWITPRSDGYIRSNLHFSAPDTSHKHNDFMPCQDCNPPGKTNATATPSICEVMLILSAVIGWLKAL